MRDIKINFRTRIAVKILLYIIKLLEPFEYMHRYDEFVKDILEDLKNDQKTSA